MSTVEQLTMKDFTYFSKLQQQSGEDEDKNQPVLLSVNFKKRCQWSLI